MLQEEDSMLQEENSMMQEEDGMMQEVDSMLQEEDNTSQVHRRKQKGTYNSTQDEGETLGHCTCFKRAIRCRVLDHTVGGLLFNEVLREVLVHHRQSVELLEQAQLHGHWEPGDSEGGDTPTTQHTHTHTHTHK